MDSIFFPYKRYGVVRPGRHGLYDQWTGPWPAKTGGLHIYRPRRAREQIRPPIDTRRIGFSAREGPRLRRGNWKPPTRPILLAFKRRFRIFPPLASSAARSLAPQLSTTEYSLPPPENPDRGQTKP
jgi:hypothetical protein